MEEVRNLDTALILEKKSIILGLDIGTKTVGIAVSDRRLKIASSIKTLFLKNTEKDFENLMIILNNYNVGAIIFGWPVQMNGIAGEQCKKVEEFINELKNHISTKFIKWDERFSTRVVDNIMISADLSRKRRKEVIDKTAAVYILQGALDYLSMHR